MPAYNGRFCCDQSPCEDGRSTFLFEGALSQEACVLQCASTARCNFMTYGHGWCHNSEYCNTTHPFAGGSASTVHTYAKPGESDCVRIRPPSITFFETRIRAGDLCARMYSIAVHRRGQRRACTVMGKRPAYHQQ